MTRDSPTMSAIHPYRGKRALDLVLLAVAAVPAVLAALACAIIIRTTSRGPVIFRQRRVGRHGEPFTLLKFRTMVNDPVGNPLFPDPRRITRAGRWLRRLSLDELPQLAHIATGKMSFVGPRPTLPYQVARYDDRQRQRLALRPGITGLAQIRGRNSVEWAARIDHDLEYVRRQSPRLDLTIIARTLPTVLIGSGAGGHPSQDPLARLTAEPDDHAQHDWRVTPAPPRRH